MSKRNLFESIAIASLVFLVIFVGAYEISGKLDQRDGCTRGKLDRVAQATAIEANASNWRDAAARRDADGDHETAVQYRFNASIQDEQAKDLRSRTGVNLDCKAAFPLFFAK